MNLDVWLPWLITGISIVIHTMATLILSAYPARSFSLSTGAQDNGNGQFDPESIRQLDTPTRVVVIAVQGASLVMGALGMAAGLPESAGLGVTLSIAGGATIVARFFLHAAAAYVAHRNREKTRRAMFPLVWISARLGSAPGVAWLATSITGRTEGDETSGLEASEALKESLDLLEEDQIPADESELRMIRGILRMDTVKVREIMRPRPDMVIAPVDSRPEDLAALMKEGGHSKIPVYGDDVDTIVGIVYSRDLLAVLSAEGPVRATVRDLARQAIHVPELQNLERLLREFQEHRTFIAIVVDEYGSVAGLVTVTDLIEEIVGELVDEFDVGEPEIQQISEQETVADAAVSIDALNQLLGTALKGDGFGTLGGLVFKELGKIPSAGDRVRIDGLTITVQSTVGRRIRRVRIIKGRPPA